MANKKRSIFTDVLHLAGIHDEYEKVEKASADDQKSFANTSYPGCLSARQNVAHQTDDPLFNSFCTFAPSNFAMPPPASISFIPWLSHYVNYYNNNYVPITSDSASANQDRAESTAASSPVDVDLLKMFYPPTPPTAVNQSRHCSIHTRSEPPIRIDHRPRVRPTKRFDSLEPKACLRMGGANDRASERKKSPPRFQCSDCNRSYSTFSGLSKHKQFHCASQMQRQFGCKFCEKKYSSLGAMKMHIRTHTLPCKCETCGKAFSRPWLLQGHKRTHTQERPFSCLICSRAFADRSNLRAHMQTHSDVRKYKCKSCQKTFSRLSLLNKHESNNVCSSSSRHIEIVPLQKR